MPGGGRRTGFVVTGAGGRRGTLGVSAGEPRPAPERITMTGSVPQVWIATSNGRDMIRADAIVIVCLDGGGRVTARLHDEAKMSVTLVDGSAGPHPPADFHRQLLRAVAELADSSGAQLVRAHRDDRGWHWITEPL
jgi:hypothetical protein